MIDIFLTMGFISYKAPLFLDIVLILVTLLPFLMGGSILFAIQKRYALHQLTQKVLYLLTVVVVLFFEFFIRLDGGFLKYIKSASSDYTVSLLLLIVHVIVAVLTLIIWSYSVIASHKRYKQKLSVHPSHKLLGLFIYGGLIFTACSGVSVYYLLFF